MSIYILSTTQLYRKSSPHTNDPSFNYTSEHWDLKKFEHPGDGGRDIYIQWTPLQVKHLLFAHSIMIATYPCDFCPRELNASISMILP